MLATMTIVAPARAQSGRSACFARHYAAYAGAQRDYQRMVERLVVRDDSTLRAYKDDVIAHLGNPLIDVRSPAESNGSRTSAPAYPEEGALRAGHSPTTRSVPRRDGAGACGR